LEVKKSTISKPVEIVDVELKEKQEYVEEVLKRWWYVLPEWPPADFDYAPILESESLRKVDISLWKLEPEVDENGLRKAYELEWFKGIFKDYKGKTHDFRPRESCPSYSNLITKTKADLIEMLKIALDEQLKELNNSDVYDEKCQQAIIKELVEMKEKINSMKLGDKID